MPRAGGGERSKGHVTPVFAEGFHLRKSRDEIQQAIAQVISRTLLLISMCKYRFQTYCRSCEGGEGLVFNQILVPGPNLWITVLLALVPLIVLLCLPAVFRMTACDDPRLYKPASRIGCFHATERPDHARACKQAADLAHLFD